MIQINNLTKSYGTRVLFENLSLKLNAGNKVGFVGRNGTGKSTLFKIILDEEPYDSGEIIIPKNYRIGTLRQHLHFTHKTVREECASVLTGDMEHEVYRVEKILFGLGFTQDDLEKDPLSFSGGYQIRLNLVKLLVTEPNLLLLDEPTNYLDIVSLRWLASFIRAFEGEVILITHDRDFMDSVTTHTMGLRRRGISIIKGNSHKYYEMMESEDELYLKTKINHDKKRAELEDFVARNKARASTATLAQSKQKELDKMGIMESLEGERDLSFSFSYRPTPSKITMEVKNLSFGYRPDEPLFEKLSFVLEKNKCLAIIGKNGKGKSTLLNTLAGLLTPEGEILTHPATAIAHFGQTNIDRLDKNRTISEEIQSADNTLQNVRIRGICGTMMFSGDDADKKISILSGGERSRVMLGKIIATPANLLFLDEPTNHLDMQSIDSLCDAVKRFEGSVVIVTHSEMLLRELADQLIIFREGGAEFFDGNYDDFLEKIGWDEDISDAPKPPKVTQNSNKKEQKQQRAELIQERSRLLNPLKKEIDYCENTIMTLEDKVKTAHEQLIVYSNQGESGKLMEVSKQVASDEKMIEELFERLEIATNEFERITQETDEKLETL
ncbi:MAG: ABC transporter ATP-binding protein [Sulfuricurvum sp. RIFOXYD2_FULL_44_160]|uniref:ABC transporter ATP-binding protein n=1 Tax=Sulfuricurvum kujiense TaxID=148813 RepID=A0A2D3WC33_9BACT|nr:MULTISPECIES: ABC-F family ATP-binding cassette domain-containing protein [Sulfuricurvum]OHD91858.1 MAG: ABC transporter ATP-binding protein [Sulfuricurvum sp. RIFOXYD12_FULL_44_77]OHD95362.1 MAG: ABC transporter ATP-binding protein [Sulfuricurvum sp. RIFOXYD2_FULL_44_160]DAB37968.1 MAG TPA: ABC transporter ATP-binding protein [Sulfuricurvum kujiense]